MVIGLRAALMGLARSLLEGLRRLNILLLLEGEKIVTIKRNFCFKLEVGH